MRPVSCCVEIAPHIGICIKYCKKSTNPILDPILPGLCLLAFVFLLCAKLIKLVRKSDYMVFKVVVLFIDMKCKIRVEI